MMAPGREVTPASIMYDVCDVSPSATEVVEAAQTRVLGASSANTPTASSPARQP